jgi:hypothetical protein
VHQVSANALLVGNIRQRHIPNCVAYLLAMRLIARVNDLAFLLGKGMADALLSRRTQDARSRTNGKELIECRSPIIADIHGNLPALEAVLADIERRHIDRTINVGDCVSGPLWPREVCDLLMASDGPLEPPDLASGGCRPAF